MDVAELVVRVGAVLRHLEDDKIIGVDAQHAVEYLAAPLQASHHRLAWRLSREAVHLGESEARRMSHNIWRWTFIM